MSPLFHVDIPKRSCLCFKGQERLLAGMEYYSLILKLSESQKIVRRDFCSACWHTFIGENSLSGQTYWKSRIESKKRDDSASSPSSQMALALELLKKSIHDPQPNEVEAFILALFLARGRRLILREEFLREGEAYLLYEILRQDEFLTIKKINPSSVEIEKVQHSLALQLTPHS